MSSICELNNCAGRTVMHVASILYVLVSYSVENTV